MKMCFFHVSLYVSAYLGINPYVVRWKWTEVSEESLASVFRVRELTKQETDMK
jgi:hypothetical protein